MKWLSENYKWLFDGVAGAAVISVIGYVIHHFLGSQGRQQGAAALTAQGAKVTNSPVASGSGITQTINSPTINLSAPATREQGCDLWLEFSSQGSRFLLIQNGGGEPAFDVVLYIPADGSGFKSDVINRLDNDRNWIPCTLEGNFVSLESIRKVLVGTVLDADNGEVKKIPVLIRYRTHSQQSCECHLEIRLPLRNGIQFALPEVGEERARTRVEATLTEAHRIDTPEVASAKMTTDEDQSSWPDVILECQWPSLAESRIRGSRTVRRRPWILRYRGPGAVYNVRVHRIDFGAYQARIPYPVATLTDIASVHPIICQKSDGLMITTHDLESLIHNPPSGCDVQQYAVEGGIEGEETQLDGFVLEVEIPVTISYDDKNGNRFKIKYLLHYDTYMEKGEMIRPGRIEKVAPK